MTLLSKQEQSILSALVNLSQEAIKQLMIKFLQHYYDNVVSKDKYVYATGTIPIALCAHLDTVFMLNNHKEIYYNVDDNTMWSTEGVGFDDRAGIYAIIQIIKDGYRPHIILCEDEEIGGIGALSLAAQPCPFSDLRYIIEVDRANKNDCVFYDDDDDDFVKYIESFGFVHNFGSFSDISFIAPQWNVGAVNLSIGYYHEHTRYEYLSIDDLFNTIDKIKQMLIATNIPYFKFHERDYDTNFMDNNIYVLCNYCNKLMPQQVTFKLLTPTGYINVCSNCVTHPEIVWCQHCGNPFTTLNQNYIKLGVGNCPICQKEK